jgi:hypothetical protein
MTKLLYILLLSPLTLLAQENTKVVDLSEYCKNSLEKKVDGLNCDTVPPLVAEQVDEKGKKWVVRFHFGNTMTRYFDTDVCVESDIFTKTLEDLQFIERRSSKHFNPKTWRSDQFLKWIDEPTNTMALTFEKNKNVFYFTAFHPKFLKTFLYKEVMVDGKKQYELGPEIGENKYFNQPLPEGYSLLYIGNTHMNMMWQIGYGRKFNLVESKKWGTVSYIPRVDAGINTGQARSVRVITNVVTNDYREATKIQGTNVSIGHRVEWQKGVISLEAEHKLTHSTYKHGFGEDGTAKYDLDTSTITVGLGVDLLSNKRKLKKLQDKAKD